MHTNRKNSHRKRKLDDELLHLEIISNTQEKHWSPEQIAGRLSVDAGTNLLVITQSIEVSIEII